MYRYRYIGMARKPWHMHKERRKEKLMNEMERLRIYRELKEIKSEAKVV